MLLKLVRTVEVKTIQILIFFLRNDYPPHIKTNISAYLLSGDYAFLRSHLKQTMVAPVYIKNHNLSVLCSQSEHPKIKLHRTFYKIVFSQFFAKIITFAIDILGYHIHGGVFRKEEAGRSETLWKNYPGLRQAKNLLGNFDQ